MALLGAKVRIEHLDVIKSEDYSGFFSEPGDEAEWELTFQVQVFNQQPQSHMWKNDNVRNNRHYDIGKDFLVDLSNGNIPVSIRTFGIEIDNIGDNDTLSSAERTLTSNEDWLYGYGLTLHASDQDAFDYSVYCQAIGFWGPKPNALSSPPIPFGTIIALKARANNKYVGADGNGTTALVVNRVNPSQSDRFSVVDMGNGKVALKAGVNNRFVSADSAGALPLIANRDSASGWEWFEVIPMFGQTVALKSLANNKYVRADTAGSGKLIADRDQISPSEAFDWAAYNSSTPLSLTIKTNCGRSITLRSGEAKAFSFGVTPQNVHGTVHAIQWSAVNSAGVDVTLDNPSALNTNVTVESSRVGTSNFIISAKVTDDAGTVEAQFPVAVRGIVFKGK
jgi:hypothetical protein